jgi:argininosuccinate synthase
MDSKTQYIKVASHEAKAGTFDKCLLLYSGGLDTSVMLKWIQEHYHCDVIALTLHLGQTVDDLEAIRQKAIKLGAKKAIVYDARERFANELLAEAIKANADYQGGYAVGCPLGRVMISRIAVEMAEKYDCQVVAHGCTGKGNDQVRFEGYITTLNPKLKTIAPVREWGMGRQEEIEYAEKHGIPVKQKRDTPYSYDENMWANTGEGGEIEDPGQIPRLDKILQWCKTPEAAQDAPELLEVEFVKGIPVAVNGVQKPLSELIPECNKIGGKHGVGVFHLIEDRVVGLKVRGVYENPAATILIAAHKKLEMLVSTREENEFRTHIDQKWAYLTYGAKYFEPVMSHLRAYIDDQNQKVTGWVKLRLYKGSVTVVALHSKYSLFSRSLATFDRDASFNQNASAGFIEIYNLPQKIANGLERALAPSSSPYSPPSSCSAPSSPSSASEPCHSKCPRSNGNGHCKDDAFDAERSHLKRKRVGGPESEEGHKVAAAE